MTDKLTEQRIAELLEMAEKAIGAHTCRIRTTLFPFKPTTIGEILKCPVCVEQMQARKELAAAARTALPLALRELLEVRKERDELMHMANLDFKTAFEQVAKRANVLEHRIGQISMILRDDIEDKPIKDF